MDSPFQLPVSSLYVHVPFCAQKCHYCAFYSEASSAELRTRYVRALQRELEIVAPNAKPRTIFFGGGTPSLLSIHHWQEILSTMERLGLLGAAEWTIECNPATVSLDKARLWRSYGVNRASLGVQSLDETLLERLGRIHSRASVFKSVDLLRQAGFANLNLDLMFAIPGQTIEIWEQTLREALHVQTEHLSCYEVIYEEDTPLFLQLQSGKFTVNEDLACAMYEVLCDVSMSSGFEQYEIANFARSTGVRTNELPDYACKHNVNYWRGGAYYGLGPSAAGYVNGRRTRNWSNTVLYCERLERGDRAIEWTEELSPEARAGETAAFGLRMNAGWEFNEFEHLTGFDLREHWQPEMKDLVGRGWACWDQQRFHLTSLGIRFADAAAAEFLRV